MVENHRIGESYCVSPVGVEQKVKFTSNTTTGVSGSKLCVHNAGTALDAVFRIDFGSSRGVISDKPTAK
jgi:hypothetical protein